MSGIGFLGIWRILNGYKPFSGRGSTVSVQGTQWEWSTWCQIFGAPFWGPEEVVKSASIQWALHQSVMARRSVEVSLLAPAPLGWKCLSQLGSRIPSDISWGIRSIFQYCSYSEQLVWVSVRSGEAVAQAGPPSNTGEAKTSCYSAP